jgi:Lon protease-like protein
MPPRASAGKANSSRIEPPMEDVLLPLFPLETVLLPEELLPLHIFEERYKTMIGECLQAQATGEGQQEFGVLLLKENELSTVGCSARILNLARKYDDGRMDILTVGRRRFEVSLTNEERPYLRASVDFFDDEGSDVPADAEADLAIERFRDVMRKLRQASEMPIHLPRPYRYLSFRLAGALPLDLELKQRLLSIRNEPERLSLVVQAIEALLRQIERVQRVQAKSGGNGNIRR